jgi:hypothetical protein
VDGGSSSDRDHDDGHNRGALQDAVREAEEAADIDEADDIDRERLGRHGLIIVNGLADELAAAITWIEGATGIRESEWGVVERDAFPEGEPLTNMRQWVEESLLAGDKGTVPFLGQALSLFGREWITNSSHVWTEFPPPSTFDPRTLGPPDVSPIAQPIGRRSHRARERRASYPDVDRHPKRSRPPSPDTSGGGGLEGAESVLPRSLTRG